MDCPQKEQRPQFHIAVKPGSLAILMPSEIGDGNEGFSLSSVAQVETFLRNLIKAAHVAFPDHFPDRGSDFDGDVYAQTGLPN